MRLSYVLLAAWGLGVGGVSGWGQLQREANTSLALPSEPPRSGYRLEVAFPGLTFTNPVAMATPPGETNRLFVVEQAGRIVVVTNLALPTRSVFLDLTRRVVTGGEQGLLGLAFHPGHATNGYFYVFYTLSTNTAAGTGLHDRLSRFRAYEGNPNLADPGSELPLITQRDEASNHNGGDLHFGPDGYLYVALGDEGGSNDSLNNSQRIDKDFFAGLLRVDVDLRPGSLRPNGHAANTNAAGEIHYAIPPDNPWVGVDRFNGVAVNPERVRTEFWAVGLRNPWRFSFDADSGLLYCADVGQGLWEEVNVVTRGGNYGWNYREAHRSGPRAAPPGLTLLDPFLKYGHGSGMNQGNSVTGGRVYRGTRLSQLYGQYVFADYVSGHVWATRYTGTNDPPFVRLLTDGGIAGFGVDPRNGDLLTADQSEDTLKRLVYAGEPTGAPLPPTLTATGAFTDLGLLTPSAGLVPYEINVPFWSDGAAKRRWFAVPRLEDGFRFAATGPWGSPTGTVWVKHFEMEMTNGVASSLRRLETRFLVRNAGGVYGVTYRWDGEGREAWLVPEEGMDETLEVWESGVGRTQVWRYPSRGECLGCHTAAGGGSLGFDTAQLNRDRTDGVVTTNQLVALARAGYLGEADPVPGVLPRLVGPEDGEGSVTERVRSYLAANCAQCHQPGGGAVGLFDARFGVATWAAGLVDGALNNPGAGLGNRVIAPGRLEGSEIYRRMSLRGTGQMPPFGSKERDEKALALVAHWVTNTLVGYEAPGQSYEAWQVERFGGVGGIGAGPWEDADGDGLINRLEYLWGTDPREGESRWGMRWRVEGGVGWLEMDRGVNRGMELWVERASGLEAPWEAWGEAVNPLVFGQGVGAVRWGPVPWESGSWFYRLRAMDQNMDGEAR